jgi:hypothetical protein
MTNGVPASEFISFEDAVQFLACGQTVSEHPTWQLEEAIALVPLVEQCKREIEAATHEEESYPLAPQDLDGSPASMVTALDQHRLYWTRSCPALYDRAIAADIARFRKEGLRRDAHQRLIDAWLNGELHLYGLDVWSGDGGFTLIRPTIADWYSEDEPGEIEIRDDAMFKHPAGAPGFSRRPMYTNLVIERRNLIDWAGISATDTNIGAERVPPAGERMVSPSPEAPSSSLPDDAIRSTPQASADTEKVSPAGNKRRKVYPIDIARMALDALYPTGVPDMTDKELKGRVDDWIEDENQNRRQKELPLLRKMSMRTISRAMGKK